MSSFRRIVFAAAIVALSPALAAAAPRTPATVLEADPFRADALLAGPLSAPVLRTYLKGVSAAGRLRDEEALATLRQVAAAPQGDPALRRRAREVAGGVALRAGRYREAADLLGAALADAADLAAPQRAEMEQSYELAEALRAEPAQTRETSGSGGFDLAISPLGLTTASARIDGHDQVAVLDTGANLSTLSESAAKALGVRFVARQVGIDSSAVGAITSRIAIADKVELGPVRLRNVVFLVLSDAALSPAGPERRIDAILGLPVLAALGRLTFTETAAPGHGPGHGPTTRHLQIAPSAPTPRAGNLRFEAFDGFVQAGVNGERLPLLLDSGATRTALAKRYARERPERLRGLARSSTKVGGAGGGEVRETAILPELALRIGKRQLMLPNAPIETRSSGSDKVYGVIGADALWAQGGYVLDFGRLNLSLAAPTDGPD